MPYADPAEQRAAKRHWAQQKRARTAAITLGEPFGSTSSTHGSLGAPVEATGVVALKSRRAVDVRSVRGAQALLEEAVAEARSSVIDPATRARLLATIATAASRMVADGALEARLAAIEALFDKREGAA